MSTSGRSPPTVSAAIATVVAFSAIQLGIAHKIRGLEDEDQEDEEGSVDLAVDGEPIILGDEEDQGLVEGHLFHPATP